MSDKNDERFFADPDPLIGTPVLVLGQFTAIICYLALCYLLLIAEFGGAAQRAGIAAATLLFFAASAGLFYGRRNPRKKRLPAVLIAMLAALVLCGIVIALAVRVVFGGLHSWP